MKIKGVDRTVASLPSSTGNWWERSPNGNNSSNFCNVNSSGSANNNNASNGNGVAPFGYIRLGLKSSESEIMSINV